jgi:hypothetical protein
LRRLVVGGGGSRNMDCDELLLLSFDLGASRKQGCFLPITTILRAVMA